MSDSPEQKYGDIQGDVCFDCGHDTSPNAESCNKRIVKRPEDMPEDEFFYLDSSELTTVDDWIAAFRRLGYSIIRTHGQSEETKSSLAMVRTTLR